MSAAAPELLTLLAMAAAIGLSPYAALCSAGLSSQIGLSDLVPGLEGLAWPPVWLVLLALLVLEVAATRHRLPDLTWGALHVMIHPLGAALFASAALPDTLPTGLQWATSLAAGLVALAVHCSILGARAARWTAGPTPILPGFTALRLAGAAALTVFAWRAPSFAAAAATLLILGPLPWWPRLWGAATMIISAHVALLRHPGRPRAWAVGSETLPPRLARQLAANAALRLESLRSTPATLARLGPIWRYRPGRLLSGASGGPTFAFRRGLGWATLELAPGPGRTDGELLLETVEIEAPRSYALVVGPAGSPGAAVLAELAAGRRPPALNRNS